MSEAKPTKGEWVFCDDGDWTISVNGESVMGDATYYPWVPSNKADWLLICDAGNTYNTTGLTPSQLVGRVKELEEALRNFTDGCSLSVDAGAIARAALSKTRPNTVKEPSQ